MLSLSNVDNARNAPLSFKKTCTRQYWAVMRIHVVMVELLKPIVCLCVIAPHQIVPHQLYHNYIMQLYTTIFCLWYVAAELLWKKKEYSSCQSIAQSPRQFCTIYPVGYIMEACASDLGRMTLIAAGSCLNHQWNVLVEHTCVLKPGYSICRESTLSFNAKAMLLDAIIGLRCKGRYKLHDNYILKFNAPNLSLT